MTDALIAQATVVLDALLAKGYEAWQGRNKYQHVVSVRRVSKDDMGRIKYIVKEASDPLWGDVRFFQSFARIRLMEGRAIELREEYLARHAEWGTLYYEHPSGGLARETHEASFVVPLGPSGYGDV